MNYGIVFRAEGESIKTLGGRDLNGWTDNSPWSCCGFDTLDGAIDGALELAEIQGDYAIDEIGIFDGESVTKAGGTPTDD